MEELILSGYDFLSVFIPFALVAYFWNKTYKLKGTKTSKMHIFSITIFALYISVVFQSTDAGTFYDLLYNHLEISSEKLNFIPFANEINVFVYFLNILLFIPFGFLIPFIWKNINGVKHIFVGGLFFSLLIELSQLLNYRSTDVDDLIVNTFGALSGYALYRLFAHITNRDFRVILYNRWEPITYVLIMFTGRFLLFNRLGLAKLIYGL